MAMTKEEKEREMAALRRLIVLCSGPENPYECEGCERCEDLRTELAALEAEAE